jgi:hypothetical protein
VKWWQWAEIGLELVGCTALGLAPLLAIRAVRSRQQRLDRTAREAIEEVRW